MPTITGTSGNDILNGTSGDDLLQGLGGNDSLFGGGGADTLEGGNDDDLIRGGDGDDLLEGGDGNDNLRGDAGSDTHDGGAGWDFASYSFTTFGSGITFDARQLGATSIWTVIDPLGGTDTLISIETLGINGTNFDDILYGSEYTERPDFFANQINGNGGNDLLIGGPRADTLNGGTGNDTLQGQGGDDRLQGGADDDLIRGGDGDDLLEGGDGNDNLRGDAGSDTHDGGAGWDFASYSFTTFGSGITFDARQLGATSIWTVIDPLGGTDTLISIETLGINGTNFDDILYGSEYTERPDFFANQINGNGGNDLLIGGPQADALNGGLGNDTLRGHGGDDRFQGSAGNDTLEGGGGADLFDYTSAVGTMDQDTIADFDADDTIDLRFNTTANQFIGAAAFTNVAGQYRYQVVGAQTVLQIDTNGDGAADEALTIANGAFELGETVAGSNILQLVAQNLGGPVSDGYLKEATVFIDVNGNRQHDAGEDWAMTGATGVFALTTYQVGTLVAINGINIDTDIANTMALAAPVGSGAINPLTTLIQAVVERSAGTPQPITVPQAQAQVLTALGLDSTLDLLNLDLIAAASTSPAAFEAQQAAAMVANLVATVEGADEADSDTEGLLVNALADLVTGGGTIDLSNVATLTPLLVVALPDVDVSAIATEISFENDAIAEATSVGEISDAQLDAHVFEHVAGGDGDDLLEGGTGRDRLVGGDGLDFLWGGEGDDLFVAEVMPTVVATKQGRVSLDVIFDFTSGDAIDVSGLDANSLMTGDQAFSWKGSNASKAAGDLSFKSYSSVNGAEKALGIDIDGVLGSSPYSGPVTIVFGNVDGEAVDFAIALIGVASVTQSDFVFGTDGEAADFATARFGVGNMTQSDYLLVCN